MASATRIKKRTRAADEHRVSVPTNLFRGGDECVGGELGAGEDEVVLLGGERLAKHNGVDPGDLAGAGGQLRHGLDVAELVGGSARRRLLAVGRADIDRWAVVKRLLSFLSQFCHILGCQTLKALNRHNERSLSQTQNQP